MREPDRSLAVSVLGAGPVGIGIAALTASRGHRAALWSPRGGGTRRIGASIDVHGLLEGRFPVRVAADIGRAVEGADAVVVAVPGHAQQPVLQQLARVLNGRPAVFVAPAASLSPLLLARMLEPRGLDAAVGGLAFPPLAARRLPDGRLWIGALRRRLFLGADGDPARLIRVAEALFGAPVRALPDLLAASLADLSGLADAAQLLAPPDSAQAAMRLLTALSEERQALCAALRVPPRPAGDYFAEIGGLPPLDAARALGQGALALSFQITMAAATNTRLPMTEAALRLLEVIAGTTMRRNPVLAALGEDQLRALIRWGRAA